MKKCGKCGIEKDKSGFDKNKHSKDGLNYWCKECKREDYIKNKERISGRCKEYYIKNKEKIKERVKTYQVNNRGKIKNYIMEYVKNNKNKINITRKEYIKNNKDKINEKSKIYGKKYNSTPKGKINTKRKLHRRRKYGNLVENTLTAAQVSKILQYQKNKCPWCGKPFTKDDPATLDHMVPLILPTDEPGIGLTFENTQLLHGKCNSEKNNNLDWENINTWICVPTLVKV